MKDPLVAFGTDGLRGRFPDELDFADAVAFGLAVAGQWPTGMAVGFDPRTASPHLAHGVELGFAHARQQVRSDAGAGQAQARCWQLGMAPTPAVAHIARTQGIAGVVVTASHNPHHDNGLKVFDPQGLKPSPVVQAELSGRLVEAHARQVVAQVMAAHSQAAAGGRDRPASPDLPAAADGQDSPGGAKFPGAASGQGQPHSAEVAAEFFAKLSVEPLGTYLDALCASVPAGSLAGAKVVADCANGAMSAVAPAVLERLGVDFTLLHASPDGENINRNCGSTAPQQMVAATQQQGADFGFALDGDGDRITAALPDGTLLDGDDLLGILAQSYQRNHKLAQSTVVVTSMTNLGLRLQLQEWGISAVEVPVGDRHILNELIEHGFSLGGEQSGHIIAAEHATTGDGLLTALLVLAIIRHEPVSWPVFERIPQALVNLATEHDPQEVAAGMAAEAQQLQAQASDKIRLSVRASGTERVLRIMVEAPTQEQLDELSQQLVELARSIDGHAASQAAGQADR